MPRRLGKVAGLTGQNISQSEGLRKWISRRTNLFESLNMEKTVKKFLIVGRFRLYHGKHERFTKRGIYFPPPRASCKALTIASASRPRRAKLSAAAEKTFFGSVSKNPKVAAAHKVFGQDADEEAADWLTLLRVEFIQYAATSQSLDKLGVDIIGRFGFRYRGILLCHLV